jgi:hypothetical protein
MSSPLRTPRSITTASPTRTASASYSFKFYDLTDDVVHVVHGQTYVTHAAAKPESSDRPEAEGREGPVTGPACSDKPRNSARDVQNHSSLDLSGLES